MIHVVVWEAYMKIFSTYMMAAFMFFLTAEQNLSVNIVALGCCLSSNYSCCLICSKLD